MAGATLAQTQVPAKQGTVEHIKVHGKSLEGNLEKDSPDRDVFIYLPPDYATNTTQRYPVVYMLHGYGLTAERWMPFTKMAEAADKNIAAGTMKGMILVNPDAYTIYNGSMYSSSVTIGDWESFIADDLVSYVDSHYRTIANRDSRGLGGHSMGGYGTIRIGMKRPDVFSSMYIMSACCLLNNPRPPAAAGQGARGAAPAAAAAPATSAAAATPATAVHQLHPHRPQHQHLRQLPLQDNEVRRRLALPELQVQGIGRRWPRWIYEYGFRGSGCVVRKPEQCSEVFRRAGEGWTTAAADCREVAGEFTSRDDRSIRDEFEKVQSHCGGSGITGHSAEASNAQLDQMMTDLGLAHTFETYEGDHTNRVPQRIETRGAAVLLE